ncbi:MAG: hypothetical protein NTV79_08640 [Candidatus Aureabacteria bacterium]|nr:hypothetical protein [Candidatus Auribacterota bacterium]
MRGTPVVQQFGRLRGQGGPGQRRAEKEEGEGLDDTIREYQPRAGTGNGFKFAEPNPAALAAKTAAALRYYRFSPHWDRLRANAFAADFSWDRPAARYEEAYRLALKRL